MKKNALSGLILLFTILLSLFACRKSIEFYVEGKEAPQSNQIESAKIWRSQHIDRSIPTENVLHAFWDDAWTVQTVGGKELIVVPAPEHKLRTKDFSLRRYFIFTVSGNIITDGNIFEFLGEKCDVEEKLKTLLPNIERTTIPEFTGLVAKYDINYHHINSISYKDGKRTSRNSRIGSSTLSDINQNSTARASTVNCTPVWPVLIGFPASPCEGALFDFRWDAIHDEDGCIQFLTYTYLRHTCPGGVTAPPSGGGSSTARGSGSGRAVSNPGYGNNPGGGTTAPDTVIINVQNPCIASAVQMAANSKSTIRSLFNDFFSPQNLKFELNITDVNTLPDTIAGTTTGYNYSYFIQLNANTLPNTSKEYALSTVYHEVLHAHFMKLYTINPVTGKWAINNSHAAMADNYIALLTGALRLDFPSLSLQEAWALSWGGLEQTPFYLTKLNEPERTLIKQINQRHRRSSTNRLGTYCTP